MLQKTVKNYCPRISLLTSVFSNPCFSINKHESMLYLKNPKLLYSLAEDSSNNLEIEIPDLINTSYSIKK